MALSRRPASSPPDAHFAATRWTVVCTARFQEPAVVDKALNELCSAYWYPLYAFLRRSGRPREDAESLCRRFFTRLLAKDFSAFVEPEKHRFRSFLLEAMTRFIAETPSRTEGASEEVSYALAMDMATAEERYGAKSADSASAELLYERQWAETLIGRVLGDLESEYVQKGQEAIFHALKETLVGPRRTPSLAAIGTELGMKETAVKAAMFRLRGRYAERMSDEVAQTVSSAEDVDDEIQRLVELFER